LLLGKKSEKQGTGKIQDNHVEKDMSESIVKESIRQERPGFYNKDRRI
jgi:hypothetical protein